MSGRQKPVFNKKNEFQEKFNSIDKYATEILENFILINKKIIETEETKKKTSSNLSSLKSPISNGDEKITPFVKFFKHFTDEDVDVKNITDNNLCVFIGKNVDRGFFDKITLDLCFKICKYLKSQEKLESKQKFKIFLGKKKKEYNVRKILKYLEKTKNKTNFKMFDYKNILIFFDEKFLEVLNGIVNEINLMEVNRNRYKMKRSEIFVLEIDNFFEMAKKNVLNFCDIIKSYYNKNISIYENRSITAKLISVNNLEFYRRCDIFLEDLKYFSI